MRLRIQTPGQDLIRVGSRRWFLQTGVAGIGGLTLPGLLRLRAEGAARTERKSVILMWHSGGASQQGEFGRSPIFSQRGTGGPEHWPAVMSMLMAGGGLPGGTVIGSTDEKGGEIKAAPFTPF